MWGIRPYVLRFWESEIDELNPQQGPESGQKRYTPQDLKLILEFKSLLFDQKMSIQKAKGVIKKLIPSLDPVFEEKEEIIEETLPFKSELFKVKGQLQKILTNSESILNQ